MTPAAELVERYLMAVAGELPPNLQGDVTRELRSLIEDKLQERSQASARAPEWQDALAVLRELGAPAHVARSYQPERFLIGPAFYPLFIKIMRIVLAGLAGLVVLLAVIGALSAPESTERFLSLGTLLRFVGLYFQMALAFFANTVIVFAILERLLKKPPVSSEWDAEDLPELPDAHEDHFGMAQAVPRFWLLILAALAINVLPRWLGAVIPGASGLTFIPLADFGVHVPYLGLNVWLALDAALLIQVFRQRHWTRAWRWAEVALTMVLAVVLLEVPARSLLHAPALAPQLAGLVRPAGMALYAVPAGVFIGAIVSAVELLFRRPAASQD